MSHPIDLDRIVLALQQLGAETDAHYDYLRDSVAAGESIDAILARLESDGVIDAPRASVVRELVETLPESASQQEFQERLDVALQTLPPTASHSDSDPDDTVDDSQQDSVKLESQGQESFSTVLPSDEHDPYQTLPSADLKPIRDVASHGQDRFRKIRKHAEGGLGMVSLAQDLDFGRDVAIKEIKERFADILDSQSRFIYEAEVTGRLEHPGVVPVYALGRYDDGRPYYAMRFITGKSLADEIATLHAPENAAHFSGRLRSLLNRFQSVCNTIEYAHSRGVLHRDLKPANIMLGEYGENLVVDWGLAKASDHVGDAVKEGQPTPLSGSGAAQTQHGAVIGTPYYMSPEQASGDPQQMGPQADVYSLGATLYHLMTGAAPFANQGLGSIKELLDQVRSGKVPSPRSIRGDLPKSLSAICLAAMDPDREKRYKSARELADDVDRYLADERVSVVRESLMGRVGRWARKNRSWSAALIASTFVIAIATSLASVITLNALEETKTAQRAVERANVELQSQLALSQAEQDFDQQIVAEEKRQSQPTLPLAEMRLEPELAQALNHTLVEIETLRERVGESPEDAVRRMRLLNVWTNPLNMLLNQRVITLSIEQQIHSQQQRIGKEYPWPEAPDVVDTLADIQQRLTTRLHQWRPLVAQEYPADVFSSEGDQWVRGPVEFSDEWLVPLQASPKGNVSVSIEFGEASLQTPMIGLVLNDHADSSYQFVVADQNYDPSYLPDDLISLAESNQSDRVRMYIIRKDPLRGDSILRQKPISLGTNLRLRARRQAVTHLTFSVGDRDVMEFQDPFPLNPAQAGQLGVICPSAAIVGKPVLEYQVADATSLVTDREIQLGDEAFAADDLSSARTHYAKRPQDVEALFKLALTYEYDAPETYFQQLEAIIENHSPSGSDDANASRWYLYAAVRLLAVYADTPVLRVRMSYLHDKLQTLYSMEDVQRLIPVSDKLQFSKMLVKSGQRSRLAFLTEGDAEALRSTIDLFSEDPTWRRMAIWRWCDAIRCDRHLTPHEARMQALPELRSLLDEIAGLSKPDEIERTAMLGDLVWMLILEKRYDEALQAISPWLHDDIDQIATVHLPLLIDRARLAYAQGDATAARRDLEAFLARVDPKRPIEGIHYSHFSEACGILGIILEEQGDPDGAYKLWLDGRIRNWYKGWPTPQELSSISGVPMVLEAFSADTILLCWSDGYRPGEMRSVMEAVLGGSGVDDRVLLNIILRSEKIPPEWIEKISSHVFSGPRGRQIGRGKLLRQDSMRDVFLLPLYMILYQGILQIAYEGDETLEKYPETDDVLYRQCISLIEHFQNGEFYQREMQFIVGAWSGVDWNAKTFEELAQRLNDQQLSSGLALVFAIQMIKYHDKLELGRGILQRYVFDHADEVPGLYLQMARDILQRKPVP
ncbi:Serine/threonine-protein kinase PknD [Rosistilla carotiformis]|uniref:Serine/threonine-protein kinase PknD n=1 Tax=Rosistilla carotiformis TaxID=2528017 RepID=A0A518JUG2_9BACT|nr:serine/threonine-protein kinase [Rosistilla carotiformis]QDV69190.1 Serine/threonine-protein kinase PknD [Rosistilla carotiformis]